MSVNNELETGMLAVIATLNFIINIAWFLVIASAIFSWLYAFNVINVNNNAINMIGRSLYQLHLHKAVRRGQKRQPQRGTVMVIAMLANITSAR